MLDECPRNPVGALGPIYTLAAVQVEVAAAGLGELDCDAIAVGLLEDAELPAELAGAPGSEQVLATFKKVCVIHPSAIAPVIVVGLGAAGALDPERLRVAAALAAKRAATLSAESLAWLVPDGDQPELAAALVEGTILAGYRFDRFRAADPDDPRPNAPGRLTLAGSASGRDAIATEAEVARIGAEAANRARELQNLPANVLTPEALAERAREIAAAHDSVTVEVLDREQIAAAGMGGIVAVSQGAAAEPRLIGLRYAGGGAGERIGLVGKGVTFDSGGISIKPAAGMHEMKMDMSGAAAVLEAFAAIAELGLGLELVAAIPATENMLDAASTRPGDIITQLNGTTVEVNNTDAEGRLILADALTWSVRELGAERIVDLATLTGAVLVALGSTYAALISNDDEWAAAVERAGGASGELVWRLPLHEEYKQLTRGTVADLTNAAAKRKAGTIYAGSFLEEFVEGRPWAHLDIAGTAWDTGRAYFGKDATGFGVRLLVRLARDLAAGESVSR